MPSIPLLAVTAGVFVCTFGVAAATNTDFRAAGLSPVGGHYQRAVETRFGDAIPLRDQAIHAWNAIQYGVFEQVSPKIFIAEQDWLFTAEEFQLPSSAYVFETELETAIASAAEHGFQLIPVIIPDKARVYDEMLDHARTEDIARRYAQVQAILAGHDLQAIDLAALLKKHREDAHTFMRTDTHWSPHGAEIVAQQIASVLEDWVVSPAPFQTEVMLNQPFRGDLTAFVDLGPYSDFLGFDAERINIATTHSITEEVGLFDDITVPIALVGTSFSAREDFNFAGFLQQYTGLGVVNFATEGQGPFVPMHAFLTSETLASSPPSIVVWELPERYISLKETL